MGGGTTVTAVSAALDAPFLRACRGEPTDRVPVWFMRQAGRSLPEYHALRSTGSMLDTVQDPDRAARITMQPVERYGVDAAILYSDIVVPAFAISFGVDIQPGVGPVVEKPFRTEADLSRLRALEPEVDTPYVIETVQILVKELDVPVIGFAGAPFTVASYLIEGGPSKDYAHTRTLMWRDPVLFAQLLDRLADLALTSLRSQIDAGAHAVQLFDSWVGALSPADYRAHVLPATTKVLRGLDDTGVPRIHFGVGAGELLEPMAEAGGDVMGIDWRMSLAAARTRLGAGAVLQGNLDPFVVQLAPWEVVAERTLDVLRDNAGHPGHVFNLGWGVQPTTDPDVLHRVVDLVHDTGPLPAG
jgi:uroporphyrinogen decarboxylase